MSRRHFLTLLFPAAVVAVALSVVSCSEGERSQPDCCQQGLNTETVGSPPPASVGAENRPFDPGRDVVFRVEHLGCNLVNGVGCGHLLAPLLARIDGLTGVDRSTTNWTGAYIRVTCDAAPQRGQVARRAHDALSAEGQPVAELPEAEARRVAGAESWWPAPQVAQLTLHEFRTHSRRTLRGFAEQEKLDAATADRLTKVLESQWDQVGEFSERPPLDAGGYAAYWDARVERVADAVLKEAQPLLTDEQFYRLRQESPSEPEDSA
jgi:hypothetical protein